MPIEIRTITPDEVRPWLRLMIGVFGEDPKDEDVEHWAALVEPGRSLAAFDGESMVATAGAFSFEMQVPGGARVPHAAVTGVTVLPTHRRRMILTRMMQRLTDDAVQRGDPIATLWASEAGIYGRFGYGIGIEGSQLEIDRNHAVLRSEGPASGRVRLVDVDEARRLAPAIYGPATREIPGTIPRTDAMWDHYFYDPESQRNGASARRWAIFERDGEPRGYLTYRQKPDWAHHNPDHTLQVGDVQAVDAEAYAALYRFAFGVDLVTTVRVGGRRRDEPLLDLVVDRRRVARRLADHIWVRIVDVPAALSARRYAQQGELVIRVVDDFGPWADGTFRLVGGPDGATCEPTDDEADLVVPVQDLGAAYLGDAALATAAWLGRVEGDPEAVVRAHRMFSWHVDPWCTVGY